MSQLLSSLHAAAARRVPGAASPHASGQNDSTRSGTMRFSSSSDADAFTAAWKVIVAVVGVCLWHRHCSTTVVATPIYQARARAPRRAGLSTAVVPFQQVTEDTARFDYFTTQLEVLRSPALAAKIAERLHLQRFRGS